MRSEANNRVHRAQSTASGRNSRTSLSSRRNEDFDADTLADRTTGMSAISSNTSSSRKRAKAFEHDPMNIGGEHTRLVEHTRKLENEKKMLTYVATKGQPIMSDHEATIGNLQALLDASQKEQTMIAHEHERALSYFCTLQRENEELKKTVQELMNHRKRNATLEKENEELNSRLLKLQPSIVVSDAQINEKYVALCDDIEDWVDTNLGDTDDVARRALSNEANETYSKTFMEYIDSGMWKLLWENVSAQIKFLVCMVQRFVMHRILTRYASGMPKDITNALSMVESQMRASKAEGMFHQLFTSDCLLTRRRSRADRMLASRHITCFYGTAAAG